MAKYVYPAIFTPEKNGGFSIAFPDVEGCYTQGKNMADGIEMAEDALCLMLYDMEERGSAIPAASDIKAVQCGKDEFVTLISCDTLEYRMFYDNKADKKTLTVPHWLNVMAERKGANFSAILQRGLKEFCGISTE
ncbi:MAG: type II toxin-antitoxin system HicB family antitoxin [Bacteroides sp.]|nr:type II toxin-antitoxin system HicB family antitoxin [Eubacterium sp.]MCM1419646.1 type II toxin-antitoxin system HicB family antitoxin [Roseburia sp.]MCM1463621.1 type II toxin-antitoxin system HicB family antitoxin [Bacteroides sp.]